MTQQTPTARSVAELIGYVGDLVGRTKLQKTAAFLELAGVGPGFSFSYHRFGPYSEELAAAVERAVLLGLIQEEEKTANWGGRYSVFHAPKVSDKDPTIDQIIQICVAANAVALELAATAAFVAAEGDQKAWDRVRELKPEKASDDFLRLAKDLYAQLLQVKTPQDLPKIAA